MYSLIIKCSISLVPPDLLHLINGNTLAAHNIFDVLREDQMQVIHSSLSIRINRIKALPIK
jgi:hypothetical protein